MKSLLAIALLATACSGTWTHNDTMEVRYTGIVAATGGALLVTEPLLNGDHLGTATTAVGVSLVALGVGAIIGSFYVDPWNAWTAAVCGNGIMPR